MRFSLPLLLGASLASTAAALPASAPGQGNQGNTAAEPGLVDLEPFLTAGRGFKVRPIMTVEEAEATIAANKAKDAAALAARAATTFKTGTVDVEDVMKRRATCVKPEVRIEWRSFPHADRLAWVKAARCLYNIPARGGFPHSRSLAEDLQYLHQQLMEVIHSVGQFNAWHRYFLWQYQEMLRTECGYPRDKPLPWWDETLDSGNFASSPIFGPEYYGEAPLVVVGADGKTKATCIKTGAFANLTMVIGPEQKFSPHCLSRAINETQTAQTGKVFVDAANSFSDYWTMAVAQEEGPHAFGHTGVGSVMGDMWASPGDPLFFMHHTFVDRNWWLWQKTDPTNRMYAIGGPNTTLAGPRENTTLDYPLNYLGLIKTVPLRTVMDTQGGTPLCYTYSY